MRRSPPPQLEPAADAHAGPPPEVVSEPTQVATATADIRTRPDRAAELLDQLLFGEVFDVWRREAGWALGQARRDGYVGHVEAAALDPDPIRPTHWVRALRTIVFSEPSIKAPALRFLSMNALVSVDATEERFAKAARSGWIILDHLAPIGEFESDPAAAALRYLGAPYLWGGRDSLGLDCSGLIQQALYACGRAAPRDSDQQTGLGEPLDLGAPLANLQRNDLVFWTGHVGLMLDADLLLHANAHHMATAVEPLADTIARMRAAGRGEPIAVRRLGLGL